MTTFLAAIIMVESGGNPEAVGDGGRSRGLMQMSRAAYDDAVEQLVSEKGSHEIPPYEQAAQSRFWSEYLFKAYMRRYVPIALFFSDYETMARTWNGGPRGAKKRSTIAYWKKVKAAMEGAK